MKPARSITAQLTLLFALSSTAILLAVGVVLGVLVDEHFVMLDMDELEARVAKVATGAAAGTVINATPEFTIPASVATLTPRTPDGLGATAAITWKDGARTLRGIAHRVAAGRAGDYVTVVAAVDSSHHVAFMAVLWKVMWASIAIGFAASVPLGWYAAHRGTAPIRDITQLAARVSAERLTERLPAESVPPELASLCSTFNDMLARLEESFRRLSDFSADLAHEMRTPITNAMTQTEVALSKARNSDEYREVLYSNLEEFSELSRIVRDMLLLAKTENALELPERVPVNMAHEADALVEFFDGVAQDRSVRVLREGEATAMGDRLMIRRALANLVSNALRHSDSGGEVRIVLSRHGGCADAAIENHGPNIPREHLARLFDRFYRVDAARRRGDGGSGLGLAITKAIAEAHRGTIAVRSEGGCTRFTLHLPAGPAAQGDDRHVMNASPDGQATTRKMGM